jgi:hypothetical protein
MPSYLFLMQVAEYHPEKRCRHPFTENPKFVQFEAANLPIFPPDTPFQPSDSERSRLELQNLHRAYSHIKAYSARYQGMKEHQISLPHPLLPNVGCLHMPVPKPDLVKQTGATSYRTR